VSATTAAAEVAVAEGAESALWVRQAEPAVA